MTDRDREAAERVCAAIRDIANASAAEIADAIQEACGIAEREIEMLESEVDDLSAQVDDLEDEANETKVREAVDRFCDEVERPVGTMNYTVPDNDRVNRAIIGLHDAIGRNI